VLAEKIRAEVEYLATDAGRAARERLRQTTLPVVTELRIRRNAFNVKRGFYSFSPDDIGYKDILGTAFAADVPTWTKGMRILDGGAGEARLFRDILEGNLGEDVAPQSVPEFVAVGVSRPDDEGLQTARTKFGDHFRYPEGRLGEPDLALERTLGLGSFDRIIDAYGASHYAPFDRIVESYGRLLKAGGKLFLHVDDESTKFVRKNENGKEDAVSAETYLQSLGGFKVVSSSKTAGGVAFELERTADTLVVPTLGETVTRSGSPPGRVYLIGGKRATANTLSTEALPPTYEINANGKIAGLELATYFDAMGKGHKLGFYTDSRGTTHILPEAQPAAGGDYYIFQIPLQTRFLIFGNQVYLPPEGVDLSLLPVGLRAATLPSLRELASRLTLEQVLEAHVKSPDAELISVTPTADALDGGVDRLPTEGLERTLNLIKKDSGLDDVPEDP
jgi:hypothetical protein